MVDIHCHILPGVDDGPKDWPTTLEMCRIAAEDGIQHIVATPHASPRYAYNREKYQLVLEELQAQVPQLKFTLGCDFYVSYDNIDELARNPEQYTIDGTRFLMAEFSDFGLPSQFKDQIFQIHCTGVTAIITHPERNPICAEYRNLAAELVDMGCLLQITGDSLLGAWGRANRKIAEKYLSDGLVSIIASDAHDPRRRVPGLSKAFKAAAKIVGREEAERMVNANPRAIVGG